jgi:hypothetical protein
VQQCKEIKNHGLTKKIWNFVTAPVGVVTFLFDKLFTPDEEKNAEKMNNSNSLNDIDSYIKEADDYDTSDENKEENYVKIANMDDATINKNETSNKISLSASRKKKGQLLASIKNSQPNLSASIHKGYYLFFLI